LLPLLAVLDSVPDLVAMEAGHGVSPGAPRGPPPLDADAGAAEVGGGTKSGDAGTA